MTAALFLSVAALEAAVFITAAALGAVVFFSMAALDAAASPFTLEGRVVNGTQGGVVSSLSVELVEPAGGMRIVGEAQAQASAFSFEGLPDTLSLLLVRTRYEGVTYTEPFRYQGGESARVELTVYERSEEWKGLTVSLPHVMARRLGEVLRIEQMYEVTNETSPPVTVYGDRSRFVIHLPPDMERLNALYVSFMGLPIAKEPIPGPEEGSYYVDQPLKPGRTRIAVSFDVPYAEGSYRLVERQQYDLQSVLVFAEDTTMTISSDAIELVREPSPHRFVAYRGGEIPAGSNLVLNFSGGTAATPHGHPSVVTVNPADPAEPVLFAVFLVLLFSSALTIYMSPAGAARRRAALERAKEEAIVKLARLDDLHGACL